MSYTPFTKGDQVKLTDRYAKTLTQQRSTRYNFDWSTRRGTVVFCRRYDVGIKWPGRVTIDIYPFAAIEKAEEVAMDTNDHWHYFSFKNIRTEAKFKLKEAREQGDNKGEKDELEYWIAWAAHANAIVTAVLLAASERIEAIPADPYAPKRKRRVAKSCV